MNENFFPSKVTPEMLVSDFLENYPQALPFFLKNHMACVGCSMSIFDSLEEVAQNYGYTFQELIDSAGITHSTGKTGPK